MGNEENSFIKKIGLCKQLHKESKFFSFISSEEVILLPDYMPNIKKVLSIIVEPEIISKKCVSTLKGESSEGEYYSGKKMVVHFKLKQKILYVADVKEKTMHTYENEYFHSAAIVIPSIIEGSNPEILLKFDYLQTQVYIHNIIIKKLNERTFFINMSLLIDTFLIPAYQLSYANCGENNHIFIAAQDGSQKKQITFGDKGHNTRPSWSPRGLEIAFLSDCDNKGKYMLYVYNIEDRITKKITDSSIFDCVRSFCWSNTGQKIIFSAKSKKVQQLFCIDIHTLDYEQLIYGNSEIKSYKPKICKNGRYIGFLQSIAGIFNLFIMDIEKRSITKLTSCGFINDFDWSNDGEFIVYIWAKSGTYNEIYLINIKTKEKIILKTKENIINIRHICFSPDNNKIAFIGSDICTENIYYYDLERNAIVNLTKHFNDRKISDFSWNIDGTQIYYGANDLTYYNLYVISLDNYQKHSLTSTTASDIHISYRPKII